VQEKQSGLQMIAQLDSVYIRMNPRKALSRLISRSLFEGRPLPARWQWTNHINAFFLRTFLHMPRTKSIVAPIFIVGMGRSGTTILGKILSMHSDACLLNEAKLLWHIACPFEDIIGNYSRGSANYRLRERDATGDVRQAIHKMYGFFLLCVGATRVIDKYPEMVFRIPSVMTSFLRLVGAFCQFARNRPRAPLSASISAMMVKIAAY